MSNDDAQPLVEHKPDAEMLFGFWYRTLPSDHVRGGRLYKVTLLGVPLVVGRDKGQRPFALRDACPHRAMPLSCGAFDGELLECSYHGWRFVPTSGQCRDIPSLTPDDKLDPQKIYAPTYPCQEMDGFLWAFLPEAGAGRALAEPLPVPRLPIPSEPYRLTHLTADMPTSVDHGIIGLMDPAHGPFVHQAWWWRSRHSIHLKQKQFEPIPYGFRMSAHTPSSNSAPYRLLRFYADADSITTTIDFVLPNLRYEQIRAGKYWFSSLTTVTPITRDRCRIDVVAAWNIFHYVPFVLPIARYFARQFIEQDRRTMEKQAEGLRHKPALMLIDDADRPARWYFQLKQALQQSRRTGQPFEHPIRGPVTLKWRS